jgi:hypothetical protein
LKTRPKQLLGSHPLAFALPAVNLISVFQILLLLSTKRLGLRWKVHLQVQSKEPDFAILSIFNFLILAKSIYTSLQKEYRNTQTIKSTLSSKYITSRSSPVVELSPLHPEVVGSNPASRHIQILEKFNLLKFTELNILFNSVFFHKIN